MDAAKRIVVLIVAFALLPAISWAAQDSDSLPPVTDKALLGTVVPGATSPRQAASPITTSADQSSNAAQTAEKNTGEKSGLGLTGKIGTLGYGAELGIGVSSRVTARLGLNAFTYKYNIDSNQVNYDFKLQLQTVSALADWYPFSGRFRTSGGLFYNNNKATLDAVPGANGYTIGNTTFPASAVGSLRGNMTFNKVAPYFGIGWGNPVEKDKGWGLVSDIGVLFQGKPKTDLVATCGTAIVGTGTCTQLQTEAAAENAKLQDDLSSFTFWPVISIGWPR